MNSKISELDSATIRLFKSNTREILKGNIKKNNPDILNEYRNNKLVFRHKYVDINGNVISIIEINASDY